MSDGQPLYNVYKINITVTNEPPFFLKRLSDQIVHLNCTAQYKLPDKVDQEYHNIKLKYTSKPANDFITYDEIRNEFTFSPTLPTELRKYNITVTLSDGYVIRYYFFYVSVINDPPYFETERLKNQRIALGSLVDYSLPEIFDIERQSYEIKYFY